MIEVHIPVSLFDNLSCVTVKCSDETQKSHMFFLDHILNNACLFSIKLMFDVLVNRYGHVGTLLPLYGTFT